LCGKNWTVESKQKKSSDYDCEDQMHVYAHKYTHRIHLICLTTDYIGTITPANSSFNMIHAR